MKLEVEAMELTILALLIAYPMWVHLQILSMMYQWWSTRDDDLDDLIAAHEAGDKDDDDDDDEDSYARR